MKSKSSRKPSRKTLLRFLDQMRDELVKSTEFQKQLSERLTEPEYLGQLVQWLKQHQKTLEHAKGEAKSQQLPRSVADLLEHHCRPSRARNNGLRFGKDSLKSKADYLRSLDRRLDRLDKRLKLVGDSSIESVEQLSIELTISCLGIAFMRYSDAMRLSYYHVLEHALLPDGTEDTIRDAAVVPDWKGTIGWLSRRAEIAKRSGAQTVGWKPLYSCFNDPKGRVAMEDLVLGNRSFIGIPVTESDDSDLQGTVRDERIIGILFFFFPINGVFLLDNAFFSDKAKSQRDLNHKFSKSWEDREEELAQALQLEAVQTLYSVSRRSSMRDVSHFDSRSGTSDQNRRVSWLRSTLFSEQMGDASDPLGFQLVADIEQDLSTSKDNPLVKCDFLFREETFVREVFDRIQMSCRYPTRWAPQFALDLQSIHEALKSSPHLSFPIWKTDTAAIENSNSPDFLSLLYPDRLSQSVPKTQANYADFLRVSHVFDANADSFRRRGVDRIREIYGLLDIDDEQLLPQDTLDSDDQYTDPFRLRKVLEFHSPKDRSLDLLVPLAKDKQKPCPGFLRLKCWAPNPIKDEIDKETSSKCRALYKLFESDFREVNDAVAALLCDFERECDGADDNLPRLKTWLDMRLAFCDAIAKAICRGLQSDEADSLRHDELLKLVADAAKIEMSLAREDEYEADECLSRSAVRRFKDSIEKCIKVVDTFVHKSLTLDLPDVYVVSIWLTRKRPIIIGAGKTEMCSGSETLPWVAHLLNDKLDKFFSDDPAAMQFLRVLLRWSRQHCRGKTLVYEADDSNQEIVVQDDGEVVRLPTEIVKPPIYINARSSTSSGELVASERVEVFTRTLTIEGEEVEVSTTTIKRKSADTCGLRIDWCWARSPIPVAVDHVPSLVNRSLFRPSSSDVRLTKSMLEAISNLESTQGVIEREISDILEDGPVESAGDAGIIERTQHLLSFLPNSEHLLSPVCRFGFATVDETRYAVLAHGQVPYGGIEREDIRNIREDSIEGAVGDITLLMQTSAVKRARDRNNDIRFLAHQLSNDLADTNLLISTFHDAINLRLIEKAVATGKLLPPRFWVQRLLLRCLTKGRNDVKEFQNWSVVKLADELIKARLADRNAVAYERDFANELLGGRWVFRDLEVARDIFLVLINLIDNAIAHGAGASKELVILRAVELVEEGYLLLEVSNASSKPMDARFQHFLTSSDLSMPAPRTLRKEHLGLWSIRHLLRQHHFELPEVSNCNPKPGLVSISVKIPRAMCG